MANPSQVIVRVTKEYVFETDVWDVPEDADEYQLEQFFTEQALSDGESDYADDTNVEVEFVD